MDSKSEAVLLCAALIGHAAFDLFASLPLPNPDDAVRVLCDEMADACDMRYTARRVLGTRAPKARQGDADADAKGEFQWIPADVGDADENQSIELELELEKRIACMLSKLCGCNVMCLCLAGCRHRSYNPAWTWPVQVILPFPSAAL
ncbi:hypothetical protein J3E68DRAFT_384087 [Trichoderma sp. SZMC 28012]